jgi:hypothetical protein
MEMDSAFVAFTWNEHILRYGTMLYEVADESDRQKSSAKNNIHEFWRLLNKFSRVEYTITQKEHLFATQKIEVFLKLWEGCQSWIKTKWPQQRPIQLTQLKMGNNLEKMARIMLADAHPDGFKN